MLDEEAKVVQEVAKATGKSLDIVKTGGEFVGEIFGESFRQFGGAIADWARYFRYKNFLRIADMVNGNPFCPSFGWKGETYSSAICTPYP